MAKTIVLTNGTVIEAKIEPKKLFFFFKALNINPASTPASKVFNKQVNTVATGLIAKNKSLVLGERRTITPEVKPKNPPTIGPYNIAPNTIGINPRFIFTGVGIINISTTCKRIWTAKSIPVVAIIRVLKNFLFSPIGT